MLLVLFSYIPLILIGFILDTLLSHFFNMAKANAAGFNALSLWVYSNLAGYRFLPQEIMTSLWLLMIIVFMLNAFTATDVLQFQKRFLYSFFYLWGMVLTVVMVLTFACVQPFDQLSARPETITCFGIAIHALFIIELLIIILLPAVLYGLSKRGTLKTDETAL